MRIKKIFTGLSVLLLLAASCQKDENNTGLIKGSLSINIGLFVSVNEVENNLKSTLAAEDFKVVIHRSGGEIVTTYERASDIPAQVELDPGQYYVVAHSNNNLPASFDNPYYFGQSAFFTIASSQQQTVTVNCELANTIVTLLYSDKVKSDFINFSTLVYSSAGSLLFVKDETRSGYFQPLPLNIKVSLIKQLTGGLTDTITLTGTIPNPQPRKKYEIHVDAPVSDGSAAFQIVLDETIDPVEIINISGNPVFTGVFNAGDLFISEIMYDPVLLSDTEGEWFEIYNNTNFTVDLYHLVIRKNDTEQHIVNSSVMIEPHGYYTLARAELACTASKYVYGTAISLNNTGAVLSLYNYGTDGSDGSLICGVNYEADGFPNGSGASISLNPQNFNPVDILLGTSWCVSVTAYSTGDLGTPGLQNDACL